MSSERVATGIDGLDKMLEGGIPKGRIVLVVGTPGTGKTILCNQFLVNGIDRYNENGIFVSLEERKDHIYQAMKRFKWNLSRFEEDGKFHFLDASPIRHAPGEVKVGKLVVGKRDFSMLSLINTIESLAKSNKAERIVVDPLAALIYQYPQVHERRNAFLDLIEALTDTGATCLITMESSSLGTERSVVEEEYLADGSIILQRLQVGKSLVRVIQVRKMRMTAIDEQPRAYTIDDSGIKVFPEESLF
jgi:circadian clock protein KaiC